MKTYFRLLNLWILLAMPLAAGTVRIYVANKAGTTIDVIDAATNKVVQVIKDIESPETARFSPDGSRVYITSQAENVMRVLDRKSGKLIKKVPISGWANDIAVTKDGRRVLVCIQSSPGGVDVIDTVSLEKVQTIPTKDVLHDIVVTGDGKYAIVGSNRGNFIDVLDLQSEQIQIAWETMFDQEVCPLEIESNPDGSARRIFIQLDKLDGFAVVDFAKRKEVARIKFPDEPTGFAVGRSVASHGMSISPDGKSLWVNSTRANAVFVYSVPELKLLGHISMPVLQLPGKPPSGVWPRWNTFTPDGKTLYVLNSRVPSVEAIDTKTMKEVAQIPVGEGAERITTLVAP